MTLFPGTSNQERIAESNNMTTKTTYQIPIKQLHWKTGKKNIIAQAKFQLFHKGQRLVILCPQLLYKKKIQNNIWRCKQIHLIILLYEANRQSMTI